MWKIPVDQIIRSFARANYATLPIVLLLIGLFYWVKAIRWKFLLEPLQPLSTRDVFPALMIGFMGNNVLPARLGEFIRVYVLGRQFGLSKMAVLSTVILERILDIATLLLLLGAGLFLVDGIPQSYRTTCTWGALATIAGFALLAVYLVWTEPFVRGFESVLSRIPFVPDGLRGKLTDWLELSAIGLASMKSPRLICWIAVTSLVQWLCNALIVYLALRSFDLHRELGSPILTSFIVLGFVAFGVTVPSVPGFFGVIQICFWAAMKLFGVSQADAFAASVYYHMTTYIPVTLLGLYYLNRLGLRLSEVGKASSSTASTDPESQSDATPVSTPESSAAD